MVDSYENLEGKIWLDGELVDGKMQISFYSMLFIMVHLYF